MINLNEINFIRLIVNDDRSFGHQRAVITLMQKLRQLGFKWSFDIWCDEK